MLPRCRGSRPGKLPLHQPCLLPLGTGVGLGCICFSTLEAGPISKALDQPSHPNSPASGTPARASGSSGPVRHPAGVSSQGGWHFVAAAPPVPPLCASGNPDPADCLINVLTVKRVSLPCTLQSPVSSPAPWRSLAPPPSASSALSWVGQGLLCLRGLKTARLGLLPPSSGSPPLLQGHAPD